MKCRARPSRQSDDRELPSAGVRLLSFALSSIVDRKNEEVRFRLRLRLLRLIPRLVHTGRSRSIRFDSFVPTASRPVLRLRGSHRIACETPGRRCTSLGRRCVRRVASRRAVGLDGRLGRDPGGWMDGSRSGRFSIQTFGDATTAGWRPRG